MTIPPTLGLDDGDIIIPLRSHRSVPEVMQGSYYLNSVVGNILNLSPDEEIITSVDD